MIWNKARECMSRDELMTLQGKRLVSLVKKVYYSVEYYRRKMQQEGIEPGDIRGIEDLNKLPFTTKEDLRKASPYDFLAVPQSEIVRYHSSGAVADTEIVVGCTRHDIEVWTECVARCIHMAGFSRNDTIQIVYDYGLFSEGLGIHRGAEKVGASVVLSPINNMENLIKMMKRLNVTGMICAHSYLLRIGRVIESMGEMNNLKLKAAICGAELLSERMHRDTKRLLNIETYDIYGLDELAGLGVACDCKYHKGLHIQEDYFVPEVLYKNTNIVAKDGESGELVFTTLQREGTPLLRYRTGKQVTINRDKCDCGRTSARIRILGDKINDIFVIRGVSIFPFEIEDMFERLNDMNARYLMRIYAEANLDMIDVLVAMETFGGTLSVEEEFVRNRVVTEVRNTIGITPRVLFTNIEGVQEIASKRIAVVDERKVERSTKAGIEYET